LLVEQTVHTMSMTRVEANILDAPPDLAEIQHTFAAFTLAVQPVQ
jgi:hypothetical protein